MNSELIINEAHTLSYSTRARLIASQHYLTLQKFRHLVVQLPESKRWTMILIGNEAINDWTCTNWGQSNRFLIVS